MSRVVSKSNLKVSARDLCDVDLSSPSARTPYRKRLALRPPLLLDDGFY